MSGSEKSLRVYGASISYYTGKLEKHGCWRPLFLVEVTGSRYDPEGRVPFRGRKVHYHNAG